MMRFEFELTPGEIAELDALPASAHFTAFEFANYRTPQTPALERLDRANERKTGVVHDWIAEVVAHKRVLDTFSANGVFSLRAAEAGAAAVSGVEWDPDRVRAATLVAEVVRRRRPALPPIDFAVGDVYRLADALGERQFDVTLCLGGLYHVADPPFVLRQLRAFTGEHLIVQTSSIVKGRKNHAQFRVRGDAVGKGLTSIVGGSGKWDMTASCFRAMLAHGGFEVIEEKVNPPGYAALCRAV
jgi:tRNA (mo5U34)-methyltransferase